MQFGLWIEPEMVNPDSDLYRDHPDWILSTGDRVPLLHRHQLVLDLSRDEVREHLFEQIDAVLSTYDIDAVKWDHNRDLLEAGSSALGGAPVVHRQTLAFYRLLDDLRAAHPTIDWESCASGWPGHPAARGGHTGVRGGEGSRSRKGAPDGARSAPPGVRRTAWHRWNSPGLPRRDRSEPIVLPSPPRTPTPYDRAVTGEFPRCCPSSS